MQNDDYNRRSGIVIRRGWRRQRPRISIVFGKPRDEETTRECALTFEMQHCELLEKHQLRKVIAFRREIMELGGNHVAVDAVRTRFVRHPVFTPLVSRRRRRGQGRRVCEENERNGHADSFFTRTFRDHPWRWMRARSVRILAIVNVAMILAVWLSIRWNEIPLHAVQKKWMPFHATILGSPRGLFLSTQHPEGLSSDAMELLDDGPWPFVGVCISSQDKRNELRDGDVLRAVPSMMTIQQIGISHTTVLTDKSLLALSSCPRLTRLDIFYCPSITSAGVKHFHSLRPDVAIYSTEPGERMQSFSSK